MRKNAHYIGARQKNAHYIGARQKNAHYRSKENATIIERESEFI